MRRILFGVALGVMFVAAAAAFADMRTYPDNASLNYIRPCSFSGKVSTNLTTTVASAATGAAIARGKVRMSCTAAVHYRMATTSPTALITDSFLPAGGTVEFISELDFVAAIRDTADGLCTITACR